MLTSENICNLNLYITINVWFQIVPRLKEFVFVVLRGWDRHWIPVCNFRFRSSVNSSIDEQPSVILDLEVECKFFKTQLSKPEVNKSGEIHLETLRLNIPTIIYHVYNFLKSLSTTWGVEWNASWEYQALICGSWMIWVPLLWPSLIYSVISGFVDLVLTIEIGFLAGYPQPAFHLLIWVIVGRTSFQLLFNPRPCTELGLFLLFYWIFQQATVPATEWFS